MLTGHYQLLHIISVSVFGLSIFRYFWSDITSLNVIDQLRHLMSGVFFFSFALELSGGVCLYFFLFLNDQMKLKLYCPSNLQLHLQILDQGALWLYISDDFFEFTDWTLWIIFASCLADRQSLWLSHHRPEFKSWPWQSYCQFESEICIIRYLVLHLYF